MALPPCSRAVGYRFGRYLSTAVPLAISHCDKAAEGDDELREHCLQVREPPPARLSSPVVSFYFRSYGRNVLI